MPLLSIHKCSYNLKPHSKYVTGPKQVHSTGKLFYSSSKERLAGWHLASFPCATYWFSFVPSALFLRSF